MRPRNSGPRRRRVALSVVAGIAVALGAVVVVLVGRPSSEAPPPLPVAHEQPASPAATPEPDPDAGTEDAAVDPGPEGDSEPDELVVSVVGKVREPGLVTLPAGARVAEAVEAAGGPRPGADLLSVNLARKLVDGEQLYVDVPVPPGMEPQPGDGAEDGSAVDGADGDGDGGLVSLNSADQDELETLSGVGEVTAQRIIEWRTEHGGFTAIEELREVDGIGDKKFESLREHVSVS
ncbi:hypothetical protein BJF85_01185 [Saccharomonospora sp. CUA-673]|nr:hypothetical protein BJF85_01185 [Saccharomonospora sp. CUA-673]